MKRFLLLALLPIYAISAVPNCTDLATIIQRLERDVGQLNDKNRCETRQAGTGITECMNVDTLTAKIRELENSRALLLGIEKLKTDIRKKRQELVGKKPTRANAMRFGEAVITAQSLELLSKTMDGTKSLLPAIKAAMTTNIPALSLVRAVQYACARRSSSSTSDDACSSAFAPTPRALTEIEAMVRATDITPELLTRWQNALKIKKVDGSDYSFSQMRKQYESSIGTNGQGALSSDQISSLSTIPDFVSTPGFEFLDDINSGKISAGRGGEFNSLLSDLTDRQKIEVQSSSSLAYYTYKDELGNLPDCSGAKSEYTQATKCMTAMRGSLDKLNANSKSQLGYLLDALDVSKNYLSGIDSKTPACMTEISNAIESTTDAIEIKSCGDLVSQDQADIENEITNVSSLRSKILQDNPNVVKLRDYAVQKYHKNSCESSITETVLQSCDSGFTPTFSKEMISLTGAAFDVSLVMAKQDHKAAEVSIAEICDSLTESKKGEASRLCELQEAGGTREPTARPNPPEKPEPVNSLSPKSREEHPVRDAFTVGFGNFTRMLAQNYAQNNYSSNYTNPYGLYSSPYASSPYPTFSSFSDSILYPGYATGAYSFNSAYTPVIPSTSFYAGGLSWSTPSASTNYPSYFNFK